MNNGIRRNYTHVLDLQMFAEGDPEPTPEPTLDPEPPKKLELTQEEFDAKIAERLARERKKYADYDDLKAERDRMKAEEDKRTLEAMTESERLKAEKDESDRKATEATAAADKKAEAANQRIIRAEFKLLAKEAGMRSDALDDAYTLADKAGISVDDDGNVTGASDVITALLAAKPFLAEPKKEPRKIGEGSGGDDPKPDKTKEQILAAAAEKARQSGRIEDRMAYAALKEDFGK